MQCDSPFYVLPKAGIEKVPVPCGRCPPCKLRRVNGWVFRMMQEAKRSDYAHFVTLTYDTNHVPISPNGFMTLRKKDFQDYMKRLRKLVPGAKLKYYAVGEYGTNNNRPHFHAVIFNCPDVQLYFDAWSLAGQPFGGVHVGQVTSDSIAYTMKYIDKQKGKKLHARDDREPEFPLMSKSLGSNYLTDEIVEYHQADISRLYATKEGGHRIALPRYYRLKIYTEQQQKEQQQLIQEISETDELMRKQDFERMYAGSTYTWEQYQESKKYGRYRAFYSQQKNRDL